MDLIAYADAHPGKFNFGVPNGAPPHVLAAWFKSLTTIGKVDLPIHEVGEHRRDLLVPPAPPLRRVATPTRYAVAETPIRAS
jgi:hypothetical protein